MAGRPTVYREDMPEELELAMSNGKLDYQVFANWKISKDTFYRWLREKPELKEAYDKGFSACEAYYTRKLQDGMDGLLDKGAFNYVMALLNNKFRWAARPGQGDIHNTQVNINNLNVFKEKSQDELLEYIQDELLESQIIDIKQIEELNDSDE